MRASQLSVSLAGGREEVAITVRGDLDIALAPQLEQRAMAIVAVGTARVVVDLAGVTFLSTAGLAVLVRLGKEADRAGTSFVVANPSALARLALQTTGLTEARRQPTRPDPPRDGT